MTSCLALSEIEQKYETVRRIIDLTQLELEVNKALNKLDHLLEAFEYKDMVPFHEMDPEYKKYEESLEFRLALTHIGKINVW